MAIGTLLAAFPGAAPAPPDRPGLGVSCAAERWSPPCRPELVDPEPRDRVDPPAASAGAVHRPRRRGRRGRAVRRPRRRRRDDQRDRRHAAAGSSPLRRRSASWPTARRSTSPDARASWVVLNFFQSSCVPVPAGASRAGARSPSSRRRSAPTAPSCTRSSTTTTRGNVEAFFDADGGDWPVVYDDDGSIAVAFGVSKVPETWIIDPSGVVRGRIISRVTRRLPRPAARLQDAAGCSVS